MPTPPPVEADLNGARRAAPPPEFLIVPDEEPPERDGEEGTVPTDADEAQAGQAIVVKGSLVAGGVAEIGGAAEAAPIDETEADEASAEACDEAIDEARDEPGHVPPVLRIVEAGIDQDTPEDLPLVVEALLLAAEEPPSVSQLAQATNVARDAIEEALDALESQSAGRGVRLQRNGSTLRLVTAPEAGPFIERLLGLERPNRLSKAALETLAIIAYQQPMTRARIEAVRGVSCDAPLATLRARELVQSIGQSDAVGHPHLWATGERFLEHFGLGALSELPPLPQGAAPSEQGRLSLEAALSPQLGLDAAGVADGIVHEGVDGGTASEAAEEATFDASTAAAASGD